MQPYPIFIYKIFWGDSPEFYVGSSKQKLSNRMTEHRKRCKKGNDSKLYKFMEEKGVNSFQYTLLATHSVISIDEQRMYEQKAIDELKPTLNSNRAFCLEDDKETLKKFYGKTYRLKHKEELKERRKKYYSKNRERLIELGREYRKVHKLNVFCDCGASISQYKLERHKNTHKHKQWEHIHDFIYS